MRLFFKNTKKAKKKPKKTQTKQIQLYEIKKQCWTVTNLTKTKIEDHDHFQHRFNYREVAHLGCHLADKNTYFFR